MLQAGLLLAGIAALVELVRHVGAHALLGILQRASPALPLLAALEVARVGCDALATYTLCPPGRVPLARLIRAHVVAYPVASLLPAGKTTSEAVKAALLSPHLGVPRAAAVAAANQALSLVAAGLVSVLAAAAALWRTGGSVLTLGVALLATMSLSLGLGLAFAARGRALGSWITRRFARVGQATAAFQRAARERPPVPPRTLAPLVLNRVLQAMQYGLLLAAVGAATGPVRALMAYGVNGIGAALGDFVPAQVGVTDGAFTLAAPWLGLAASAAVAISVLVHVVQVSGSIVGIIAALAWRQRPVGALQSDAPPSDNASRHNNAAAGDVERPA